MVPGDGRSSLFVFSHPNHELAVFGHLQRLKPHIVYLTDGGGEERVAQTRRGLDAIGLLGNAVFLNVTEGACYGAFVARNAAVFHDMSRRLRDICHALAPARIYCDAVEFYNPVHDVALPVVLAAVGSRPSVPVYEIPLISQRPAAAESYRLQRPAGEDGGTSLEMRLTDEEHARKLEAFHSTYHILRTMLTESLAGDPLAFTGTEVVVPARPPLRAPSEEIVLRYERRARLLREQGAISDEITWGGHYVPVASSLLEAAGRQPSAAAKP